MDSHAPGRDLHTSMALEKDMASRMLGAMIFAMAISVLLFGALSVQVYMYFTTYKDDRLAQKCTIGLISILSGLMVVFSAITVFLSATSIVGGFNPQSPIPWSMKAQVVTSLPVISVIHILHARRIWILCGDDIAIPLIVSIVVIGGAVLRMINISTMLCASTLDDVLKEVDPVMLAVFAGTAATDIAITSALWYYLRRSMHKMDLSSSKSTLGRLARGMLYSGATSCAWSLCALFMSIGIPNTWLYMIPMAWSTVYTNSFLAMVLSRQSLRSAMALV